MLKEVEELMEEVEWEEGVGRSEGRVGVEGASLATSPLHSSSLVAVAARSRQEER